MPSGWSPCKPPRFQARHLQVSCLPSSRLPFSRCPFSRRAFKPKNLRLFTSKTQQGPGKVNGAANPPDTAARCVWLSPPRTEEHTKLDSPGDSLQSSPSPTEQSLFQFNPLMAQPDLPPQRNSGPYSGTTKCKRKSLAAHSQADSKLLAIAARS